MLFELVTSIVGLALKPLLLAKLSCQFGFRSISIVILTWIELLRFSLSLHVMILCRLAMWAFAVLSLPVRAFTALHRERMLEMQLHRLRNELENVLWDRKDLEEQLRVAIKERKMMEKMLVELEEEHDEAIVKIELLQGEVKDLEAEMQRLKEVQGKSLWSYADNIGKSSQKPDQNKNTRQVAKDLIQEDETHNVIKAVGSEMYELSKACVTDMISTDSGDILDVQRRVALSRSLFSAILSLLVGIVMWEAKDPCMPLVMALLMVVIMSLMSVRRLFTAIEQRPAFDAVVLLSLNWFILGTLMYPVLPRIARLLAPLASSLLKRTFGL